VAVFDAAATRPALFVYALPPRVRGCLRTCVCVCRRGPVCACCDPCAYELFLPPLPPPRLHTDCVQVADVLATPTLLYALTAGPATLLVQSCVHSSTAVEALTVRMPVFLCLLVCVHVQIYLDVCRRMCVCECMHLHLCVCVCVCMSAH
jgi:hypothetical protein